MVVRSIVESTLDSKEHGHAISAADAAQVVEFEDDAVHVDSCLDVGRVDLCEWEC